MIEYEIVKQKETNCCFGNVNDDDYEIDTVVFENVDPLKYGIICERETRHRDMAEVMKDIYNRK